MSELQQIMSIQENLRTFEDISLISSTPSISLAFNKDFFSIFLTHTLWLRTEILQFKYVLVAVFPDEKEHIKIESFDKKEIIL